MHPEVLNNKRKSNEIYFQFCQYLDIFKKINNLLDDINLEQFIDFYSGISSSIPDYNYFSIMINNVWKNIENENDSNNVLNIEKALSSSNKLNIGKFCIDYNNCQKNNINQNYCNKVGSVKDKNSNHTRINLPLFYYNKYANLNDTSQSNCINENKFEKNNNLIFTPNSRDRKSKIYDHNEETEINLINKSSFKSPSYNGINAKQCFR